MINNLAPVILFVYDRPLHTEKTIKALKKNTLAAESVLYVFSDAPKNDQAIENVRKVREYIKTIRGFKKVEIVEREYNWGLASSVIDGATKVINLYGKAIVLEDDLLTSSSFLTYMNQALDVYEKNNRIFSITGFSFSEDFLTIPENYKPRVFFHKRPMSWSWATWSDRWNNCEWDIDKFVDINKKNYKANFSKLGVDLPNMLNLQFNKRIDSWYVRFCYNAFLNNMLTVYPVNSFVSNIGHDGTGVHCSNDRDGKYLNEVNLTLVDINETFFPLQILENEKISINFNRNFVPQNIFLRLYTKIINILK